jgi:hypothetical protein
MYKKTLSLSHFPLPIIYEWSHPQIDEDWDIGNHQWREITPATYRELSQMPRLYTSENVFMESEPV